MFLANDLEITIQSDLAIAMNFVADYMANLAPGLGEVKAAKKFFVSPTGDLTFR